MLINIFFSFGYKVSLANKLLIPSGSGGRIPYFSNNIDEIFMVLSSMLHICGPEPIPGPLKSPTDKIASERQTVCCVQPDQHVEEILEPVCPRELLRVNRQAVHCHTVAFVHTDRRNRLAHNLPDHHLLGAVGPLRSTPADSA